MFKSLNSLEIFKGHLANGDARIRENLPNHSEIGTRSGTGAATHSPPCPALPGARPAPPHRGRAVARPRGSRPPRLSSPGSAAEAALRARAAEGRGVLPPPGTHRSPESPARGSTPRPSAPPASPSRAEAPHRGFLPNILLVKRACHWEKPATVPCPGFREAMQRLDPGPKEQRALQAFTRQPPLSQTERGEVQPQGAVRTIEISVVGN